MMNDVDKFMSKPYIGVVLTTIAFLIFLPWINRPFTGHHDFTGAFYSQMARNYLRYGLITTKLGQVTNFGETTPEQFSYHTHHPPMIPLLVAMSYGIFGEREWAARLIPLLFALGATYVLFRFIADHVSITLATVATILTISSPLFVYTAILPEYEAAALFLILLQFYSFYQLTEKGDKFWKVVFFIAAVLGFITAWVTYFAIPLLTINELLKKRTTYLSTLLVGIVLATGFFGLHVAHTKIVTGEWFGGGLGDIFFKRIGATPEIDPRYIFSIGKYLETETRRLKDFYGIPLLVFSAIGATRTFSQQRTSSAKEILFLLLGVSLILPVFFRNYVFVHDYMLFYTAPLLGFATATTIQYLLRLVPNPRRFFALCLFVSFLIAVNALATHVVWRDLWGSKTWYEASVIIGNRLRQTTTPKQSILIVNQLLRDQETQLAFYADRAISFPSKDHEDDPDVIVNVSSDFQFPEKQKGQILQVYRLEVKQGVEYYYRK